MFRYSLPRQVFLLGLTAVFLLLISAVSSTVTARSKQNEAPVDSPVWDAQVLAILGDPTLPASRPGPKHELRLGWDKNTGRHIADPTIKIRQLSPAAHAAQLSSIPTEDEIEILQFRSGFKQKVPQGFDAAWLARVQTAGTSQEPLYGVVQFSVPIRTEIRYELENAGFRFYNYVPEGALYAYVPATGLSRLGALMKEGTVRYAGPIPLEARLEPGLLALANSGEDRQVDVVLQLFDPPNKQQFAEVEMLMKITDESLHRTLPIIEGRLRSGEVLSLAQMPFVRWLEVNRPMRAFNFESTMALGTDITRAIDPVETTGHGIQVGVIDSGIATYPYHMDLPLTRVFDQYDYVNNDPVAEDGNGHGTHVAGTVGGSGAAIADFFYYQGQTPAVEFLVYRLGNDQGIGYYPIPFQNSLIRGTNLEDHKLDVVNTSWGGSLGIYESRPEIADRAVRGEYGDRKLIIVAATGNSDELPGGPSIAKNVISVGALVDGNWPDQVYDSDCETDRAWPPAKRACYSNHGPVDVDGDGYTRVKPDVMAPGTMITSATPGGDGDLYKIKSGTSMAAPAVTGAAAAFLDYYAEGDGLWILDWPEVVKAMIIANALPVGDNADLYGYGQVDTLGTIFALNDVAVPGGVVASILNTSSTQADIQFDVPAGYKRLRLVLTWSDPAGAVEVVHNLDLRVYSNASCSDQPIAKSVTEDDTVEVVNIPAGQPAGTWCARVSAVSLTEEQPFALAYSGILREPEVELEASIDTVEDHPDWRFIYSVLSNEGATVGGSFASLEVPEELEFLGARIYTADGRSIYYPHNWLYHPPGNTWYAATGALSVVQPRFVRWLVQIPDGTPDGTYRFQVDGGYRLQGATVPVAAAQAQFYLIDDYEPDDVISKAVPIASGESQVRSLVPNADADWATFILSEPTHIEIMTAGPEGDTMLALFDSSENLIVSDDDGGGGGFSRIERTCAADQQLPAGRYYIEAWGPGEDEIPYYTLRYLQLGSCSSNWYSYFPVTLGSR